MIRYAHPSQVQLSYLQNRPILSTQEKGYVSLDATLLALWQYADGRSLEEINLGFHAEFSTQKTIQTALACLSEAGLLERHYDPAENEIKAMPVAEHQAVPVQPRLIISAVIVNYNSAELLKECITSLKAQTFSNIQIIVVDNGSFDGALGWLETNYPDVQRVQIKTSTSLSHAINTGASQASPDNYLLILNPDVRLQTDAVAMMVSAALSDSGCAAVAPKLYFSWAPAFLNGIGNYVRSTSWGTDNAIGHLDLGQFNAYRELPSACFAAALITPDAWKSVGPLDEGFPMYYEDIEWCYRARLKGFRIIAAPTAEIFHAFGGSFRSKEHSEGMSPAKLSNVVYGRQRFAIKLLKNDLVGFLRNYISEDLRSFIRYLASGDLTRARAYLRGWGKLLKKLPVILAQRRLVQASRLISDDDLFKVQREMPLPLVWNGLPELTWDLINDHYHPMITANKTRLLPEFHHETHQQLLVISTGDPGENSPIIQQIIQNLKDKLDINLAIPMITGKNETELLDTAGSGRGYIRRIVYPPDRLKSLHLLLENCDIAIIPGELICNIPHLEYAESRLIILLPSDGSFTNETNDKGGMLFLGDFYISTEAERSNWVEALKAKARPDVQVGSDLDAISHYCLEGSYAPDRDPRFAYPPPPTPGPENRFALMLYIWRTQGFRTMFRRARRYLNQHYLQSTE